MSETSSETWEPQHPDVKRFVARVAEALEGLPDLAELSADDLREYGEALAEAHYDIEQKLAAVDEVLGTEEVTDKEVI